MDKKAFIFMIVCLLFLVGVGSYYLGAGESVACQRFMDDNCFCGNQMDLNVSENVSIGR